MSGRLSTLISSCQMSLPVNQFRFHSSFHAGLFASTIDEALRWVRLGFPRSYPPPNSLGHARPACGSGPKRLRCCIPHLAAQPPARSPVRGPLVVDGTCKRNHRQRHPSRVPCLRPKGVADDAAEQCRPPPQFVGVELVCVACVHRARDYKAQFSLNAATTCIKDKPFPFSKLGPASVVSEVFKRLLRCCLGPLAQIAPRNAEPASEGPGTQRRARKKPRIGPYSVLRSPDRLINPFFDNIQSVALKKTGRRPKSCNSSRAFPDHIR